MEDSGIVSKKFIIFIGIAILVAFAIWIIYSLNDSKKEAPQPNTGTDVVEEVKPFNDSYMYGKYINAEDKYSYLEITKDGYTYVMNVCEGYVTYKSDEFVFNKNVTTSNNLNTVTIKLTSNTKEVVNVTFIGSSASNINEFTGTSTCSSSNKYIKTLE